MSLKELKESKRNDLLIVILMLILSIPSALVAQSQVQVTISGIPQILPSPFISDFEQNVFAGAYSAQINVTGSSSVRVRFNVRVTLGNEVLVDETSLPEEFDPGFTVLSPFTDFVEFNVTTSEVLDELPSSRVRQAYQTGAFPEGDYRITIEPQVVGSGMPGIPGFANFMVRYPQPPTLVSPNNGETIAELVSTPVFMWSPVNGPPGSTFQYDFLLVEVFENQTPEDAILSNREHASTSRVGATMVPYTPDFLPLEEAKTYAWQVTASDVAGDVPLKNEGRSEIYTFTYSEPEEDEDEQDTMVVDLPDQPVTPVVSFIPVTTITGTAEWSFRPSEGAGNMQPVNSGFTLNLETTDNSTVQTALDDPNFELDPSLLSGRKLFTGNQVQNLGEAAGEKSGEGEGFSAEGMVPVYGGGVTENATIEDFSEPGREYSDQLADISDILKSYPMAGASVKAVVKTDDGSKHVIATGQADENGTFSLTFVPSELAQFSDMGDNSDSSGNTGNIFQQQGQDNQTVNLQDQNNMVGQGEDLRLAVVPVQIVVDSPYFEFAEETTIFASINNTSTYNAGTLKGTALTYRLNPTVSDMDNERPIEDAVIEIFRPAEWYDVVPAIQGEGWPGPSESEENEMLINGSLQVKVAEADASGMVTRLFTRKKGLGDRYTVRVSAEGYNPLVTHLSSAPDLDIDRSVTIEKNYQLQQALPVVEGRVVRKDSQAPLADIPVVLKAPGGGGNGMQIQSYIARTDQDGRFTISDIAVKEDPYTLIVKGPKISTYEEEVLLNERGLIIDRDPLMVDPTLITIVGKVVNDESVPIANASIRWESGGTPVQSDQHGRFTTANTVGTHVLQVRKIGHQDADTSITISIEENESGFEFERESYNQAWDQNDASDFSDATGKWIGSVMNTETYSIIGDDDDDEESGIDFGDLGFNGNVTQNYDISDQQIQSGINENNLAMTEQEYSNAAEYLMNLLGESGSPGTTVDIGNVIVNRSVGKLDLTVEAESDGAPISGATVTVGETGPSGDTDDQGNIYFGEAPGGTVRISVKAPATTNYVPELTEVTIADNGEVTSVTVSMEMGGRAVGTVTANGNPVEDATIRLEGREEIATTSASDGTYTLPGIPTGEWTLKSGASGYVGDSQTATFTEDTEQTVDFSLQDSGFNIAELLGFEIEVDELQVNSDTTITGAFVSIPSNDLFSVSNDLRIPFTDVRVYEENGELKPVESEVQTDVSEIRAKLFDVLHIDLKSQSGLVVKPRLMLTGVGYIAGKVQLDYESTFTQATGWEWPQTVNQFLKLPNRDHLPDGVGENELVALTSDGSFPVPALNVTEFELSFGSTNKMLELYGFDFDLNLSESVLKSDGFHLSGDVSLSNIPLFGQAGISIESLWIDLDGHVREAALDLDPQPELDLSFWTMQIASGSLSENGFSMGGAVEVQIPGSNATGISFSDLTIAPDQIFGGQFSLPSAGIDIFNLVSMQAMPGTDISFGKVQDENVYYVRGSGKLGLPSLVDEQLAFRDFLIRNDGEFSASIESDFEVDFHGLADLAINGVEFETEDTPSIYVDGQFGLYAIPFISAQAGGITYEAGGNVSVDDIDLDFEIGSIGEVGVGIGFVDNANFSGFEGSGNINITGTPIEGGIDFIYQQQRSGGITFGADFQAGIPPIPVGTLSITDIGGGFEFNTSNNNFRVTVRGGVIAAPGTDALIELNPIEVNVQSGPVITGSAALKVMTQQIADADLTIDFPNSLFDVEARVGFEKLNDVNIDLTGKSRLVVSGAQNDTYWMVGAFYNAELFDLFDANANILAAWNLDVNAHPEYSEYTNFVSSDYMTGGEINGVHLDVATEFGIQRSNQQCLDFEVGRACAYFYNRTRCKLNVDFASRNFGFYLGSNWQGGGSVKLLGEDIAGANIEAQGEVTGSYYDAVWSASGSASANVSAYIGDCNVGCQTKFCWPSCGTYFGHQVDCPVPKGASLCASGSIDVDYRSTRGMQVSVSLN